jgi:capsular polysaccharide export protein
MIEQIAVLSPGVWKIRNVVKLLTGCEPVRWMPPLRKPQFGCVAGWGFKHTSQKARHLALRNGVMYIAFEDGFVRSIAPGANHKPISFVVDRSGVYYNAAAPSDLERHIIQRASCTDRTAVSRARAGMHLLRSNKLSKYNHAPHLTKAQMGLDQASNRRRILVVDQTFDDASVTFGLADSTSFNCMLDAAISENSDAEIIIKLHPEVICGRKKGYLAGLADDRVNMIYHDVNPWSLIEIVDKVYVVTSQLGLEAIMANRVVVCFGAPFYSGWGLTDDRVRVIRSANVLPTPEQLFAAVYFDYARYVCHESNTEVTFESAMASLLCSLSSTNRCALIN